MYNVIIMFALIQHNGQGHIVETHGKFETERACNVAAGIVHQDRHPLPRGHVIECQRRAEVLVLAAAYTEENE